jgi:GTP-binding protein
LTVEFVTSGVDASGFPRDALSELALVGRSNVGKSSVINALARRRVARTSAAPGKTRLANFYRIVREGAPPFHLVDLPGYGYARGGDAARHELETVAGAYFGARTRSSLPDTGRRTAHDGGARLVGVLLLVDSRHPGLDADRHAWSWLQTLPVARAAVATKVDKLTRAERVKHLNELERIHEGPVLGISAQTGEGLKDLWKTIDALLQ